MRYQKEKQVVGFFNLGDRVKLWGRSSAIWGGQWGLLVTGLFMTVPLVGSVVVLGHRRRWRGAGQHRSTQGQRTALLRALEVREFPTQSRATAITTTAQLINDPAAFEDGAVSGFQAVTRQLVQYFPAGALNANELPDKLAVI